MRDKNENVNNKTSESITIPFLSKKTILEFLCSNTGRILITGLVSRILVFVSALIGMSILGITTEYPKEILWDIDVPLVNLFSRWDTGYYSQIAISGYPSGNNPLAIHWAWFPLFPIIIGSIGRLLFGIFPPLEAVSVTGFLFNNILFFICLIVFYKLSEVVLKSTKLAFLSSLFFCFWPGSLFFSCVYSETLFMTLMLGAFYFLEKEKGLQSTILGFFAGLTKSSGLLIIIPFVYNFSKKRSITSLSQIFIVALPYLIFNLIGSIYTGFFPVRDIVYQQYWGSQPFFMIQLFNMESQYAILFYTEILFILVPFIYMLINKDLLVNIFTLGIIGENKESKYFGFAFVQLILILFFSIIANVHRYALAILPLYWVFARIWEKNSRIGIIVLIIMSSLLVIGSMLFSTWRWYW